jgi:hypothetical protein
MTKELLQQCLDALKSCRNVDQQWQIFDPQKVLKAVTDITVALAQQEQRSPNESELAALKADAKRLDWLLKNTHMWVQWDNRAGWIVRERSEGLSIGVIWSKTPRLAIDAAMKGAT